MALRSILACFSFILVSCAADDYEIPEIKIEILRPQGLRMSIPDKQGIGLFAVQGNVNKIIASPDVGQFVGEVLSPNNGRWTFEKKDLKLSVGDEISYYVFVSNNGNGYLKDNLSYTVTGIGTTTAECETSVTTVKGKPVCSGETIFFDDFISLDTVSVWRMESKIALDHPEYPFISYQPSAVDTTDGNLRIKPSLQQNKNSFNAETIFSGTLDLSNWCTGPHETCSLSASGSNILPPVVSGRITAKHFWFRYGVVEIRAKLPLGDWLYPELLLLPFMEKYGTAHYASGLIKIAGARGNRFFVSKTNEIYGNQRLYGGPILDSKCRDALLSSYIQKDVSWGNDFHIYSLKWEPDRMSLSVDGQEWGSFAPSSSMRGLLPEHCQEATTRYKTGSKMAPFDEGFILSLGLAAGGISEFPDDFSTAENRQKPWRNTASKAKLRFWEDMTAWYPTWNEESHLLVDYVKVTAL